MFANFYAPEVHSQFAHQIFAKTIFVTDKTKKGVVIFDDIVS